MLLVCSDEKSHGGMVNWAWLDISGHFYTHTSHPFPRRIMLCKSRSGNNVWLSSIVPMAHLNLMHNLCVKNEGSTDLVGGLVELLGIKGGSKTEGDTRAEENVVSDGGDTTVIDLSLNIIYQQCPYLSTSRVFTLAKDIGSMRYLLATSRPTWFPLLESQVALAPAST